MITVVGSRTSTFNYIDDFRRKFFHEDDPNNFYYNEMCGHKYNLEHLDDDYIGLEHYRRTFARNGKPLSRDDVKEILKDYDIIVKGKHGPYGTETNLTVLIGCSRYKLNYYDEAKKFIDSHPELSEQAYDTTHYGCNMLIAPSDKYKTMLTEEFAYITEMQKFCKQHAMIGYFAETILTPYMIKKHNTNIYIADVV